MKQIAILCLIITLFDLTQLTSHAQTDCEILNWHDANKTQEAGEVVFVADDMIWIGDTPNEAYHYMPDEFAPASTSPDGTRLAWVNTFWNGNETESSELHLLAVANRNHRSLEIHTMPFASPYRLHWINSQNLLTVYSTHARIRSYYPVSVIAWDTLEVTYIPPWISDTARWLREHGHSIHELLTYGYNDHSNRPPNFSPNSRFVLDNVYLRDWKWILFDTQTQEIRELENLHSGERGWWHSQDVWSSDSTQLLSLQINATDEQTYEVMLYDIQADSFEKVLIFDIDSGVDATILDNGWSPNKRYVVVSISDGRNRAYNLNIADLTTKQVKSTCFDILNIFSDGQNLAWSLDGRYLAFNGLLETDTETGTIYVYDTQTDIAYKVFTGDAEIIGWLR